MKKNTLVTWAVCLSVWLSWVAGPAAEPNLTRPGHIPDPHGYWTGDPFAPDSVASTPAPAVAVEARARRQQQVKAALDSDAPKHILFGDMHVHSTYSTDAFRWTLPMMKGARGAFPPADACDYARYIAQLDFYWITDHAEAYTPRHWQDSVEAIRQCSAVAGDTDTPDLVAFVGWEWTQMGATAEDHYGHHNVFFRDIEPGTIPARPIGAAGLAVSALRDNFGSLPPAVQATDPANRSYYEAFERFAEEMGSIPHCESGKHVRELPLDCLETAADPAGLFAKLEEWGFDTIVAPHGSAWGIYTPPGSSWDYQLTERLHDPDKLRLIEVYSGHGNSENYRSFRPRVRDAAGRWTCPRPQASYLPRCWQAGEIVRKRCTALGLDTAECDARAARARHNYVQVDSISAWRTVPGSTVEEWLDAGQARDIFLPAFNYRPLKSVQYGLARRNFDDPHKPLRYRWGFISSTDTHTARPGTGFKQYDRQQATDTFGERDAHWREIVFGRGEYPAARSVPAQDVLLGSRGLSGTEFERLASFWTLGGLVAVHATDRSRQAIWDALKRREVYGTSGPRILLWFDLLNGADAEGGPTVVPMGGATSMGRAPRFRVRAVGSFQQRPGCPDWVTQALSRRRLDKLGSNECYHPSDERYVIDRIEVVRIRPQNSPDEALDGLIEDAWQVFRCEPSQAGCQVEFSDPDFSRDTVYYVRAIEEDTPTINGRNLRTTFDRDGRAVDITPCYGDFKTRTADQCLSLVGQRAWSSPIYVDYGER